MTASIHIRASYGKLEEFLPFIEEKGLGAELFISAYQLDHPLEKLPLLDRTMERIKGLSLHTPFMDLNAGSLDPQVRKVTFNRMVQAIEVVEPYSPKTVVLHSGYDDHRYKGSYKVWLENSLETWGNLLDRFSSLTFVLENVFESSPRPLVDVIEGIDSPRFGHCMDVGHFNVFSEVSQREWFDRLGGHLREVHLHDNLGLRDQHLPMGAGNFDFKTFFPLLHEMEVPPLLTLECQNPAAAGKSLAYLEEQECLNPLKS